MANGKLQPFTKIENASRAEVVGITMRLNVPHGEPLGAYSPDRERWENNEYSVWLDRKYPLGVHLAIRRKDLQPAHDWRDLQAIKTALVGPEYEALELYPAESRVMDVANEAHLYVMAGADGAPVRIPVGHFGRREVNSLMQGQRPI